ncbi:hypothetical protein DMB92_05330 [Campylobacter sp. MIT 99-7217]|uniref:hypothetical protein n=1 Tax=Campylobacter sp. MIT 99-7217 TaxID=535091 RepID=UPI00115A7F24|nr:hypothetical protein [Campylobacter sp. MIT 99-7217]TQR31811.1 hypothetical protein DMB92_05330 [Campylobacter sp. MIT 99-7217]
MKNFSNSLFFVFEKSKLKKEELNLKDFTAYEQEKIIQWFKYKALKRNLNILSKQRIIKQLREFKARNQDISKIIDQSILKGWQGLFFVKTEKKLEQNELLELVLKEFPEFNFTDSFDLSTLKIKGQSVKYNASQDKFVLEGAK